VSEPLTAPKGTYDILPDQQPLRRWVIAVAEGVFTRYGYRRIDTPLFEDTRLFTRGLGQATDIVRKEMYTFTDLGGRSMTLRPEGTAPVARAYIEHGMHTLPQPVKLYYHSPMFRYESPQAGRYRQHYQLGVEAFGSFAPELDAEVIGLLSALYRELGLHEVELRLNSMGCSQCRPAYSSALRSYLVSHAAELCEECRERTRSNPLRTFDCKVEGCRQALAGAPRLPDHLCDACRNHHLRVKACLGSQELPHVDDHTLVRGMDYYTRTTFEFQCSLLGAQSGVGGGGRYDDLVSSLGGPPVPGVGFGTGVERILLALERSGVQGPPAPAPAVYLVALGEAARMEVFRLAHQLRTAGIAVELDYLDRSPKGQMKQAGRSGARYAFILGEQELAAGQLTVRDLSTGEERRMSREEAKAVAHAVTPVRLDDMRCGSAYRKRGGA
jgi:histidyl-tRNA synthetase